MFHMDIEQGNRIARVTWDNGVLSGDEACRLRIEIEARRLEGYRVGPPEGPATTSNHIDSDMSIAFIAASIFDVVTCRGDVPIRADDGTP